MESLKNTAVFIFDGLTHSNEDVSNEMKIRNLRPAAEDEIEHLKNNDALKGGETDLAGMTLTSDFEKMSPCVYFVAVERK